MRKKILSLLLVLTMVFAMIPMMSTTAHAYSIRDTAPRVGEAGWGYYADSPYYGGYYNGVYEGNCTWYAWCRAYEVSGVRPATIGGNACAWYKNAPYDKGPNARPGSIACWDSGRFVNDTTGHVAFVESVNADGTITITESSFGGKYWEKKNIETPRVGVGKFLGYIYITNEAPTPPAAPTVALGSTYFTESQDVYISWNAVNGATSYTYYLTEYPEGYAYTTNTRSGSTIDTSIIFKASELKSGHYSCFLHATNSGGQSPQSNWVSFDIYSADYIPTKAAVYNDHIYVIYDCEMSWSFARDLCKNMGGHLVTVTNQAEETFVENLVRSGRKSAYWLGATNYERDDDVNHPYQWVTGETFSYTNWNSGEPSFSGDNGTRERFLELRKSYNYKWNDVNNINKADKGFILEIEPNSKDITYSGSLNGHQYYVIDRNTTWTEAQTYCETLGGHLVTIDSTQESEYIDKIIKNGTRAWYYLGAKRENGSWKWLNGNAANNINKDGSWDRWASESNHNYLMKYKKSLTCIPLGNAYYPEEDIKHIGFICEVEGHTHTYTAAVTAPTCTAQGYTLHTCSGCGDSYKDSYTAPLGHDYVSGVCSRCGVKDPNYNPQVDPFRFVDVTNPGDFFFASVYWAYEHDPQITIGTDATHFSPNKTCTRAQVVTFLWRANGCPEPKKNVNPFTDVKFDAYYYKAVLWAVEKGITNGTSPTTFSPDNGCTRGQVVTFQWRAIGQPEPKTGTNPFADMKSGTYYYKAVLWAVEQGITKGTSADKFSPDSTCTRGQIVTFLYRDLA